VVEPGVDPGTFSALNDTLKPTAIGWFLRDDGGSVLPWVPVALALYPAVFVITVGVHVPLNDDINAAGDPARIVDLVAVRDNFHETRWVVWNIVRAVATTVALGCLAWTLVLNGRTAGSDSNARPPAIALDVPGSSTSVAQTHEMRT
jgi:Domain of unknown function (DUF1772)